MLSESSREPRRVSGRGGFLLSLAGRKAPFCSPVVKRVSSPGLHRAGFQLCMGVQGAGPSHLPFQILPCPFMP